MIVYGARASNIGNFEVSGSTCAHCDTQSRQHVSVFGRYTHIFWIPLFPIGRKVVSECTHCKRTIEKGEFSPKLAELYQNHKGSVRRPFWHWIGAILIGLFAGLIAVSSATHVPDPREALLQADLDRMSHTPEIAPDSVAHRIKFIMENFVNEEINSSEFEYFADIREDKALILVKVPELKDVLKEERPQVIEMIEMAFSEDMEEKDVYIGVEGKISMMLIKTPTEEKNSRLALSRPLYEFYGPKPVEKVVK